MNVDCAQLQAVLMLCRNKEHYNSQIDEMKWFTESTPEAVLRDLDSLYDLWEEQIENKEWYAADDISRSLAYFSKIIVVTLFSQVPSVFDEDVEIIEKLYSHRHFGYACFAKLDDESTPTDIIKYHSRINYQRLYDSLARYYGNYYGKFGDNEEAIMLLCKYYERDIFRGLPDSEKVAENLINALHWHIGGAGDFGDTGYAFKGLSLVREYIKKLDDHIILQLLNKFTPSEIRNHVMTRKQVWNIIASSSLKNRKQLKFYFLDAVQLEEYAFRLLYKYKLKRLESFIDDTWTDADHTKSHIICKEEKQDTGLAEIRRAPYHTRSILYGNSVFSTFYYGRENETPDDQLENVNPHVEISSISLKEYTYDFYDYSLNTINYEIYKKWDQELSEVKDAVTSELALSYLWVDGYKGLENVELSLDGVFYHTLGQTFIRQDATPLPEDFFSPHILSIFAIVGQNGQGKSRILDFLRDGMRLLFTGQQSHGDSINREETKKIKETWNELENTKFVIIFRQNDEYYYYAWKMDNTLDIPRDIIEFSPKANGNILESLQVVYFTNATITDESAVAKKSIGRYWVDYSSGTVQAQHRELVNHIRQKKILENTILLRNQMEEPDKKKMQEDTWLVNLDYLRQLYFLRFCYEQSSSSGTIFFDFQHKDLCFITTDLHGTIWRVDNPSGVQAGKNEQDRVQKDIGATLKLNRNYILKQISDFKNIPVGKLHKIGYFSSGEYARLVMLARLYWYFQGRHLCFAEYGKELTALFSGDEEYFGSTILLIDEGELYYHPEWQRCFITSLLDLINACFGDDKQNGMKLQLFLTSNSPFVLTDLPKSCVKLLSAEKSDFQETFSQNIYTLISDSFFTEDVTGKFAARKIDEVRKWLDIVGKLGSTQNENVDIFRKQAVVMEDILHRIGEPVLRDALLRKYYAVTPRLAQSTKDKFKQVPPKYEKDIISYIEAFLNPKTQDKNGEG